MKYGLECLKCGNTRIMTEEQVQENIIEGVAPMCCGQSMTIWELQRIPDEEGD